MGGGKRSDTWGKFNIIGRLLITGWIGTSARRTREVRQKDNPRRLGGGALISYSISWIDTPNLVLGHAGHFDILVCRHSFLLPWYFHFKVDVP